MWFVSLFLFTGQGQISVSAHELVLSVSVLTYCHTPSVSRSQLIICPPARQTNYCAVSLSAAVKLQQAQTTRLPFHLRDRPRYNTIPFGTEGDLGYPNVHWRCDETARPIFGAELEARYCTAPCIASCPRVQTKEPNVRRTSAIQYSTVQHSKSFHCRSWRGARGLSVRSMSAPTREGGQKAVRLACHAWCPRSFGTTVPRGCLLESN